MASGASGASGAIGASGASGASGVEWGDWGEWGVGRPTGIKWRMVSSAVERGGEDTYVKKVECFSSIITMFELTTMYAHCFPKVHPCLVGAWAS